MGAFKKLDGRIMYIDFKNIQIPGRARPAIKGAMRHLAALKRLDPFARNGGRRAFETPQDLRAACDKYFKEQEYTILDKFGQPVTDPETGEVLKGTKPLTISGLGLSIGVTTTTLKRYKAIAESGTIPYEFAEVVLEALQKIENYAEQQNYNRDGQRGGQFILQTAFKWKTPKEEKEIERIKAQNEAQKADMKMKEEEHAVKMQLLKAGLDDGEDRDIHVTITRATKEEG